MSASPQFITSPNNSFVQFSGQQTGTGTPVTIFTAGASGSWVRHINVTYEGTSARTLGVMVLKNSTTYHLSTVSIPAGTGYTTVSAKNICSPSDIPCMEPDPNRGLLLESGEALQVVPLEDDTEDKNFVVASFGGDF